MAGYLSGDTRKVTTHRFYNGRYLMELFLFKLDKSETLAGIFVCYGLDS